jgi:hypothetical protein
VLLLSGCATTLPQPNVTLPAQFMQQCPPLNKLEGNTGADMLRNIVANAETYHKCSDMHSELIKAVSKDKPSK